MISPFAGKFKAWRIVFTFAIGAALLSACAGLQPQSALVIGQSRDSAVRAAFGEPDAVYQLAQGEQRYTYGSQPIGTDCYVVTFAATGVVRQIEQTLNEKHFQLVRPGMGEEEIYQQFCQPKECVFFDNLGESICEWRYLSDFVFDETYFLVHFDAHSRKVKSTSRRVVMRGTETSR